MTKSFMPGTPSWIDLGSTNIEEAKEFYSELFGWTSEDVSPEAGDYHLFRKNDKIVAGLGRATDPARGTSWVTYFGTIDADATAAKVIAHGGKVIVEPTDVPEKGRMAVFTDPTGAYFSVWQPKPHIGIETTGEHGSLVWSELYSGDVDVAKKFYSKVLTVNTRDLTEDDLQAEIAYTLLEVDGKSVAGMMLSPDEVSRWGVYFAVDDLDVTADLAIKLGAKELFRQDSPPGRMAGLIDPHGGLFSLIKPNPDFQP